MPQPNIHRLSLRGFSALRDCALGSSPEFLTKNLIYGFNGSGKTTLSRVFAALESGQVAADTPTGSSFQIELSNATTISSSGALDGLRNRVLVFNVDFIEANLRWKEGRINPVFYIGREQAELSRQLEQAEREAATHSARHTELSADLPRKERAHETQKRNTARVISEQLGLGRRYDATDLTRDYGRRDFGAADLLSEEERAECRTILGEEAPAPKLPLVRTDFPTLSSIFPRARNVLDATIGTLVAADLQSHEEMLHWLKEGLNYHESHDLSSCLLCGSTFSDERKGALATVIDGSFAKLSDDIEALRRDLLQWSADMRTLTETVPSSNAIAKNLLQRFQTPANELRTTLKRARGIGDQCAELLDRKLRAPTSLLASSIPSPERDADWDQSTSTQIAAVNAVIEAHNRAHDDFEGERDRARERLKAHYLAEDAATVRSTQSQVEAARTELSGAAGQKAATSAEVERLKAAIRQHGPAATRMNALIKNYLGHGDLEIAAVQEGYELRRAGRPGTGPLSEGEKTAIALCYFLSTIEAEGRRQRDLIVVVDDPISSLDSRALNYAFGLIKSALSRSGQLFILTHNLQFMQEVKKWLKAGASADNPNPTARLLYLEATQDAPNAARRARLCTMPTLLREYESEYHYLFQLALRFAEAADDPPNFLYIMPNALRKILDIFLAFKVPGSSGLSSKIDNIVGSHQPALDSARMRALDRLVQLESHADNLDDLVGFSSMTIEETKDAARSLMYLIQTVDVRHYDQLCRICR